METSWGLLEGGLDGALRARWVVDGKVLCWECVLLRTFAVANIRNWPCGVHASFPIRRPTMPKGVCESLHTRHKTGATMPQYGRALLGMGQGVRIAA